MRTTSLAFALQAVACLAPAVAFAQTAPRSVGLRDTLTVAVKQNRALLSLDADIEIALANEQAASGTEDFLLDGQATLVPWMWTAEALAVLALVLLLNPRTRARHATLVVACLAVFVSIWIEKGLGMIVTGFVPSPLGKVASYVPTAPELLISAGVYATGLLLITLLYKIALSVRGEVAR